LVSLFVRAARLDNDLHKVAAGINICASDLCVFEVFRKENTEFKIINP
jgi:hypothetical protein